MRTFVEMPLTRPADTVSHRMGRGTECTAVELSVWPLSLSPAGMNMSSRGWQPTDLDGKRVPTLKGSNKPRVYVLFDPSGVGIDLSRRPVGCTHGYSHSSPFGAGRSKRHTLIQRQWGRGEVSLTLQRHLAQKVFSPLTPAPLPLN